MKFIASSARKGKHLMCFRLAQDCRAGNFICGPPGRKQKGDPLSGVALAVLLMYGCYSASW